MKYYLSILVVILVVSCSSKIKVEKEIEKIPIDVEIVRFDKIFGSVSIEDLPKIKSQFPLFFPKQYHDSIWVQKIQDTLQKQLTFEVAKKFPSEVKLKEDLELLFQHIKYYFPQFNTPKVITTTSDVDYRNKVILSDSLLIIALDTYLGKDHHFYGGIPKYVVQNLEGTQISSDVASIYSQKFTPGPSQRTFLSQMIYYGKMLYLKDLWMTTYTDSNKIGYTEEQFLWAEENESEIWRNFVENEFLFSTNTKLLSRFINPAPFSKFYLEIDNESPGMIGRYIGWKIVRSYMDQNTASLEKLLSLNAEEIFNKSKYKPKK